MQIESLTWMSYIPRVDMFSLLTVLQCLCRSCQQTILTMSTMKAELVALDTTTVEVDWLHELLMDFPIVKKLLPTMLINCENQTVIVKVDS
jgi:hypothetical protein